MVIRAASDLYSPSLKCKDAAGTGSRYFIIL